MLKRYVLMLAVIFASMILLHQPTVAKEDTAQIKLKKTAVSNNKLYTYTVKSGDTISSIIKQIPGIKEKDVPRNYQLIQELNPDIPDLENLEAGQLLVIPGKPSKETEESKVQNITIPQETRVQATPVQKVVAKPSKVQETRSAKEKEAHITTLRKTASSSIGAVSQKRIKYKIRKGDTLYKIIRRELRAAESDIPLNVRVIKSINPHIKNVNKIYVGTVIQIPGKTLLVKTSEEIKPVTTEMPTVLEKTHQPEKIIEIKEKKIMPQEARLAVLKQIVNQMNGTLTTTGNYYLPIPKAGQVTIDCSQIPVAEFDDNTTVFIDLENRAHANLRKMISDHWTNYFLIKVNKDDHIIDILKKIINSTKHYRMVKSEKPILLGSLPPVEIVVDWMIIGSLHSQQTQPMQAIRLIYENNPLLPKSVKNYFQKNGLLITEISEESGIVSKPEELYSLPPIPVFPTTSAQDFSYALVSHLGLSAEKDIDIQLFDTIKDGFNLSIKADVLVKKDDKKYVIYSQALSQQFIHALKQAGHETIFVNENDSPNIIMENVLNGLGVPFASGNYTFSGLEKNQAPYALKFHATKIHQDFYVVDFDMDQELRGLLKEIWSVNIVRY